MVAKRLNVVGAKWTIPLAVAALVLGCPMQPPGGNGNGNGGGGGGGTLPPSEPDGAWTFVPDSDAIPSECYVFESGTLTFYSNFCDEVTDLEAPAAAVVNGSNFRLTFEASIFGPEGAIVTLEGTIQNENSIRVQMTLDPIGEGDTLSAPGRLARNP